MHDDPPPPFHAAIATLVTLLTICWRERCPVRRRAAESEITEALLAVFVCIDQAHAPTPTMKGSAPL